jgi:mevalonate kinase
MYFDSLSTRIWCGSSGALVAAIYDKYAQDKITVLENLTREKLLQLKTYFLKWRAFHGKVLALTFKQLFDSKTISRQLVFQVKFDQRRSLLLDSGIVGETAPMVTIFMENLKDKGFRTMLKPVCKTY